MKNTCPDCGLDLPMAVPLSDHRGDPCCLAQQRFQSMDEKLEPAGPTWKTQQAGGVAFTWIITEVTSLRGTTGVQSWRLSPTYTRFSPRWATLIARCTVLDAAFRTTVIAHCLQHPAAKRAVEAGFAIGGVMIARDKTKQRKTAAIRDFFDGILLTVGQ